MLKYFRGEELKYLKYRLADKKDRVNAFFLKNKYILYTSGLVALVLIVIVASLLSGNKYEIKPREIESLWFYDLNTKELFADKIAKIPPIKTQSGPLKDGGNAGVYAVVVYYDNPDDKIIAYLLTYTFKGKEILESVNGDFEKLSIEQIKECREQQYVKRVEDTVWYPARSDKGKEIKGLAHKPNAKGRFPVLCYPDLSDLQ